MTADELNAMYERKKKETLDKLIGPDVNFPVHEERHVFIDKNWSKGISWHDQPRVPKNIDYSAMAFLKEYNEMKYKNGGKIVTYIDPELEDEKK